MNKGRKRFDESFSAMSGEFQIGNPSHQQLHLFDSAKGGLEVIQEPYGDTDLAHQGLINQAPSSAFDIRLNASPVQLVVAMKVGGRLYEIAALREPQQKMPLRIRQLVYGPELFNILKEDLGIVGADSTGHPSLRFIFSPDSNPEADTVRFLGRIAEALIVRRCRQDPASNKRWAMYARRGKKEVSTPDKFMAIGTSLKSTRGEDSKLHTKYSPNDPQRDIVWVKKDDFEQELLSISSSRTSGHPAGLQIKVSRNGWDYIRPDLLRRRYEVPVVYFDLGDDFHKIKDELYKCSRLGELQIDLERDFLYGRKIGSEIYDKLTYFAPIVTALIKGEITAGDLVDSESCAALIVTGLERIGKAAFILAQ